ncbi:hypothetical protein N7454_005473 [Penicillium verhagenii]|nr:hypothetical protein N7454_005473 [Penicillium verhagenii]
MKATTVIPLLGLSGAALGAVAKSSSAQEPWGYKSGSKGNRAFDNILGGIHKDGLDNVVNNGPFYNPQLVNETDSKKMYSQYKDYDSVLHDPDHSVTGVNFEMYGTFTPDNEAIANGTLKPSLKGFVERQMAVYPAISAQRATDEVLGYYSEDEVPTLVDLVDEFTTFNYWHSCVPGPTNPNRLCALSGTSDGHGENDDSFLTSEIEINGIFEEATKKGISWLNYDGTNGAFLPDALFYNWTAENAESNVVPLENFYQDAYLGLLPQLSYINPSCCGADTNSMHPSGNVSFGQVLVKQVYDAVRTGPQWDKTLIVLTFDETGGFFDHVAPPLAVRPDDKTYTETASNGQNYTLNFDRLGGRMPTWLISPTLPRATSRTTTLGYLWDIEDFTPRVAQSPAFDHLIGPNIRSSPATLANPHTFADAV